MTNQHVEISDPERIKTEDEDDLRYWTETFGVTRHQLINAIQQVGTSIPALNAFIATGKASRADRRAVH